VNGAQVRRRDGAVSILVVAYAIVLATLAAILGIRAM